MINTKTDNEMSAINIWLTCVLLFIVVNVGGGGTVPEYCLGRAIGIT
jgi:hypothetical protein